MSEDKLTQLEKRRENLWFELHEKEQIQKVRQKREEQRKIKEQQTSAKELKDLKDAHYHKCPSCGHDMESKEIQSLNVVECSFCGGFFFEHSQLFSILDHHHEKKSDIFKHIFGLK